MSFFSYIRIWLSGNWEKAEEEKKLNEAQSAKEREYAHLERMEKIRNIKLETTPVVEKEDEIPQEDEQEEEEKEDEKPNKKEYSLNTNPGSSLPPSSLPPNIF